MFLRHDIVRKWEGAREQSEAAAAARCGDGRAGVGYLTNWFIHAAAVGTPRSPSHAALAYSSSQVSQHPLHGSSKFRSCSTFSSHVVPIIHPCSPLSAVIKAWSTFPVWSGRTWCCSMTCCWRCLMPTPLTVGASLGAHAPTLPSKRLRQTRPWPPWPRPTHPRPLSSTVPLLNSHRGTNHRAPSSECYPSLSLSHTHTLTYPWIQIKWPRMHCSSTPFHNVVV